MEKGGDFNGACAHSFHTSLSELLGSPTQACRKPLEAEERNWVGRWGEGIKSDPSGLSTFHHRCGRGS